MEWKAAFQAYVGLSKNAMSSSRPPTSWARLRWVRRIWVLHGGLGFVPADVGLEPKLVGHHLQGRGRE